MNEELLALFNAAGQRGEFKNEVEAASWLRARGYDAFGNSLPDKGSPFMRGLGAGVGAIGLGGTAERLSRAFGFPEAAEGYRAMSMEPSELEAQRAQIGTAPEPLGLFQRRPQTFSEALDEELAPSKAFSGGAMLGAMGTEVGKAYAAGKAGAALGRTAAGARIGGRLAAMAPGAARVASRLNPWTLAAITALGAAEDVGSLPEESTAGMLGRAARSKNFTGLARALEAMSESATGRAITGATLGIVPEGMILGAPAAYRAIQRRLGMGDVIDAQGAARAAGATPSAGELPKYPGGYIGGLGQKTKAAGELDINTLFDELAASLPVEPKRPTVSTAGSRRRPQGVGALDAEQQRMLTGALAEMHRGDLGRGATRTMAPIEAERQAQQIVLRRNKENAGATTTQQKAAVERMHAEENARLEGTPVGEALKRIAPAAAVGAVGLGALSQLDEDTGPAGAMLAGAFLPGMGRSLLRRPGRGLTSTANVPFLDRAYSRLETGLLNAKQERMTGRQWASVLKGEFVDAPTQRRMGVPQSEIEWTGLGRFLDENADRTLSRDDVADWLGQNRLELKETVITPHTRDELGEPLYGFEGTGAGRQPIYGIDATTKIANRSNYRDVIFSFEPVGAGRGAEWEGPHYTTPNTVLHVRMFDVELPDNQRVLYAQEVQSDLHQGARAAGGYATPEYKRLQKELNETLVKSRQLDRQMDRIQGDYLPPAPGSPKYDEYQRLFQEREAIGSRINEINSRMEAIVPNESAGRRALRGKDIPPPAPFAKTEEWSELGLKRILDEAVRGGYNKVVFANWPQVSGATKFANIFDDIDTVSVGNTASGLVIRAEKNGKPVKFVRPEALRNKQKPTDLFVSLAEAKKPVVNRDTGEYIPEELAKLLSKYIDNPDVVSQLASRVKSFGGEPVVTVRSNTPFTVGDLALRTFYDESLPSTLKKYLKTLGVTGELSEVMLPLKGAVGIAKKRPNVALTITPALSEAVSAGQRLLAPALLAGGAAAGASALSPERAEAQARDEAEAQRAGIEFGMNLPTILALGIGGAAVRSVMTRATAARAAAAAERAAPKLDLMDVARRSAQVMQSQEERVRQAARAARAGQRIAEPAGLRPADAWNTPKTPTDVFQFAARIASDPDGARAVAEATEQALESGLVRGGRITWETEKALAKQIGVDPQELALRDPSRTLSGPEFLALTNAYEAESRRKILLRQVMDDPMETPEARRLAAELYDVVDTRATTIFQRLTRDRGETGRMMNLMKAVKAQSTNPADWLYKAQKLAGGRALSPEMAADLIKAIDRGEFVKAKMVLGKVKAANTGILDKAGEFFQTALLSRLGRPIRDLISNAVNSQDRRAQYAIASKLDALLTGFGVYPTRSIAGGVSEVNRAGKLGARKGWQQAYELIRASPTRELTPEAMDALERAARRYDFSDETSFTNPFLRAWGTFVRRTIAATDQPFYESGLAMALETQARAMGTNMKLKGQALEDYVTSTLANPTSEMVATAIAEGAEAVFQQKTTLGRAASALGGRGSKNPLARFIGKQLIPFAQTPSAIATQALEQTPLGLIGALLEPSQRAQVMKLAKVSTGSAWMYAGYVLADDGKMNLFYPDDPNERARWQEENRIANSILVNGKWVALSGLLGPQAMLLTIGGLIRDYTEKDGKGLAAAIAQASAVGTAEGLVETPAMQGVSSMLDILKATTQDDPARMEEALARSLESQATGYIPGIIQQVAAMGDVDESGRVIMRDPMSGETMTEDIVNSLMMGIPGQRENVPAKISPFGRVRSSGPGGLTSLVTPFRTTESQATPLTAALEEVGYFPAPSPRRRGEGETVTDYALRRQAEGPQEEAFLTRLLSGDEEAWQFVSPETEAKFAETQDKAELVRAALRNYRSARSRERRSQ